MAKLKVTQHREGLEDHGDKWRIEKRFMAEPAQKDKDGKDIPGSSPGHFWVVYEFVDCEPLKHPDTNDHLLTMPAPGLGLEPEKLYIHPLIKDRMGNKTATTFPAIWVPRFAGLEDEARTYLAKSAKE